MYTLTGRPSVTACTFSGNSAATGGDGVYNADCSAAFVNCRFEGNVGSGMENSSSNAVLTGCTFNDNSGYGVRNTWSSPTFLNCTFTGNGAGVSWGGGMINLYSNPTLTSCIFSSNLGFGMANIAQSDPILTDCTFADNSGDWRGGMLNYSSSPTLLRCAFVNNDGGSGIGGGMRSTNESSPTLTECTFIGNSASQGAGVYHWGDGFLTVTRCVFRGNIASHAGGGLTGGGATLTECVFSGNRAGVYGGGLSINSGTTLWNCVVTANSALRGGGIQNDSDIVLMNCTLAFNSADNGGGGMSFGASTQTLTNCIIWGNTAPLGPQIEGGAPFASYSNILGGYAGEGNIDVNPRLKSDGVHLSIRSPCRNAGDPNLDYTGQTDIDGQPRVLDGRVDMGADEVLVEFETPVAGELSEAVEFRDQGCANRHTTSGDPSSTPVALRSGAIKVSAHRRHGLGRGWVVCPVNGGFGDGGWRGGPFCGRRGRGFLRCGIRG